MRWMFDVRYWMLEKKQAFGLRLTALGNGMLPVE